MVLWFTSAMPNLVVYVPARLARSLEALNISEDIQRRACREVLAELAEGGLVGPADVASTADGGVTDTASARKSRVSGGSESPDGPTSPDRPRGKAKCSREARHHINHSGKPCPECGWPGVTA